MRSELLQPQAKELVFPGNCNSFRKENGRAFLQKPAAHVLRRYACEQLMPKHVILERTEAAQRGERSKGTNEIGDRPARKLSPFLKLEPCDVIANGIFEMLVEKGDGVLKHIQRRCGCRHVCGVESIEQF